MKKYGDRISGRAVHGTRPGPKPYLTKEEESEFIVENVAQDKGILEASSTLLNGWYYRFMERQGDLTLHKSDLIANVRMECLNE